MASGRVRRGRQTQEVIALDLRENGAPNATAVGAFLPGRDIQHVPGVSIEVKATSDGSLPAFLRQAVAQASFGDIPVVVWRPNGFGPERLDDWVFAVRYRDGIKLLRRAGVLP